MALSSFRPRTAIFGVPIHAMLVPFPIACFTGALLSDLAYYMAPHPQWANFSQWFLAFGAIMGVIAGLFGLIDFLLAGTGRPRIGWFHLLLNAVMLVLATFNNFVHARDGYTGVVPTGLTLSILTVLVMIVSGFLGHRMAYAHTVTARRGELA